MHLFLVMRLGHRLYSLARTQSDPCLFARTSSSARVLLRPASASTERSCAPWCSTGYLPTSFSLTHGPKGEAEETSIWDEGPAQPLERSCDSVHQNATPGAEFKVQFHLATDASGYGIGGVLPSVEHWLFVDHCKY
ncbi:Ribonuclease H [Fusarium albosuccineum]|uniref:Ribonuclease H n=1 Tax=Fusarium albosuccineum TaxID=1237068 RepID=A0A8H4LM45_9HYPO|nr:Ribonuclease H [Fusarium albosuccineum]